MLEKGKRRGALVDTDTGTGTDIDTGACES